ncbi:MAG: hypothetical protein K6F09_01295 [Clostridiales bacterium]|nr:hypothetical protein [Clostridiales bacterium]
MKKARRIGDDIKTLSTLEKVLWIGTILLTALLFVSHNYNDLLITTRQGIDLWKIILNGDYIRFYELNRTPSGNDVYQVVQGCAYSFLVYLTVAVWNIPIAILERISDVDVMNNRICLCYEKGIILFGVIITAVLIKKLLEDFGVGKKESNIAMLLYFSSAELMSSCYISSQIDILAMIFMLLGFRSYLRKKEAAFVAWFAVAFCFKFFSVIPFVPLLLLSTKNIWKMIRNGAASISLWAVIMIPFYINSTKNPILERRLASKLFSYDQNIFLWFIVIYCLILVYAYVSRDSDGEKAPRKALWLLCVSFTSLFAFGYSNPYWSVLMVAFWIMLMAVNKRNLLVNLALEAVGTAAYVLSKIIIIPECYIGKYQLPSLTPWNTMKPMLWGSILPDSRFRFENPIYDAIRALHETTAPRLLHSVFIAAFIAFAFINFPRDKEIKTPNDSGNINTMLVLRFVSVAAVCLIPIASLFIRY